MQRRTRIVATLGPATDRPGVVEALLQEGLDVARVNFSHGTAGEHLERISRLRALAEPLARPVAVLLDLPGPKLRVVLEAPLSLVEGQEIALAVAPTAATPIRITQPEALAELRPDQRVLLDDGRLQLRVLHSDGKTVCLRVTTGGTLLPNKGINCPDTTLALPVLTERDREALALAAKAGVDWLALSFVRSAGAAQVLRDEARRHGLRLPILAKIEKPEAVKQAREIIAAFDGIMVARGDLGVEVALERVPHVQKHLIALARASGKPVITATDMLDSMRLNPRPTRAEASDVANAVYDGSDAVMLSGETASGQYPVEAFRTMDRIARETEVHLRDAPASDIMPPGRGIEDHLTQIACSLAREIRADAILCPAMSGRTVRLVARHRPRIPLIIPVPQAALYRQLALVWGLTLVPYAHDVPVQDRLERVVLSAFRANAVQAGALVVVLAGHPAESGPRAPTLRVLRVGAGGNPVDPETA